MRTLLLAFISAGCFHSGSHAGLPPVLEMGAASMAPMARRRNLLIFTLPSLYIFFVFSFLQFHNDVSDIDFEGLFLFGVP